MRGLSIALLLSALAVAAVAAPGGDTIYVRDELRVSLRGEPSAGAYLAVAVTGETLTVIDRAKDHYKVRTPDGKEGWLNAKYLTTDPPAAVRLPFIEEQNTSLAGQVEELQNELKTARRDLDDAHGHNATLAKRIEEMSGEVDRWEQANDPESSWKGWVAVAVALVLAFLVGRWSGLSYYRKRLADRFGGLDV